MHQKSNYIYVFIPFCFPKYSLIKPPDIISFMLALFSGSFYNIQRISSSIFSLTFVQLGKYTGSFTIFIISALFQMGNGTRPYASSYVKIPKPQTSAFVSYY